MTSIIRLKNWLKKPELQVKTNYNPVIPSGVEGSSNVGRFLAPPAKPLATHGHAALRQPADRLVGMTKLSIQFLKIRIFYPYKFVFENSVRRMMEFLISRHTAPGISIRKLFIRHILLNRNLKLFSGKLKKIYRNKFLPVLISLIDKFFSDFAPKIRHNPVFVIFLIRRFNRMLLRFYRHHFPPLRRIIALFMIFLVLAQSTLTGTEAPDIHQISQTQAQTQDFYPTDYKNYLYEHRDNEFITYFGDKKVKSRHRVRFQTKGKGIELTLIPPDISTGSGITNYELGIKNKEPQNTDYRLPITDISPSSPYSTRSAQLQEIEQQLSTTSAEFKKLEEKIKEVEKEVSEVGREVAKTLAGTSIIYQDAREVVKTTEAAPSTDILYSLLPDGIKEEIVLRQPTTDNRQPTTYNFSLSLDGVYPAKPPGEDEWSFFDEDTNEELFYFEKPFAYDAKGVRTDKVQINIDTSSNNLKPNTYNLILSLDPSWLTDPARSYPIIIDPTIRLASAKQLTRLSSDTESTMSSRMKNIERQSAKLKRNRVSLTADDPPPTANFKNIEANPKATHRFQTKLPGTHSEVLVSRSDNKSVGYKLISGYDKAFWVEFEMLETRMEANKKQMEANERNNTSDGGRPSLRGHDSSEVEGTDSAKISNKSVKISNQFPTIEEAEFGQSKAVFHPTNYLDVEYEAKLDRVKANYILTKKPVESESVKIGSKSVEIQAQNSTQSAELGKTSEYTLPFKMSYPWGVIIPQPNEDDGSISLLRDQNGDGKKGNGEIITIAPPTATDAKGKIIPAFFEISNPPIHAALPENDSNGFPESIILNLLLSLDGTESYPITIDPVAIDTSAIAGATSYGNGRHIIRDNQGNGNLIAAFTDGGSISTVVVSYNGGQTWTTIGTLATSASNFTVAQDKSGNLHFGQENTLARTHYEKWTITRTNGNITSKSASSVILDSSDKVHRPSIIVDAANDLPAIAWSCEGSGGASRHRVRFARAKGDPTLLANWCNAAESTCNAAASDCVDVNTGANDELFSDDSNGAIHSVLIQMPGVIEPLTGSSGNLYVYAQDNVLGDLLSAKATIATGGTPNFKWSWGGTVTEQASDLSGTRYQDLTTARDLRNNRVVVAWTTDADTDSKDSALATQIRYRSGSDDSTTDISPPTTFSATGSGTDIGDEFQLTVDPTRNEYLLFYANSSNNIENRKLNPDISGGGVFGWKNESPAGEDDQFRSVDIFSTSLAYAVGDNGTVFKWNGTSWTNETSFDQTPNSSDDFQKLEIFSTTLAYAVGGTADSQSTIYKWNGTSWSNERPGSGENDIFRWVDIQSTTLAFAVGDDGTIWKWNGTSWSNEASFDQTPNSSDDFQRVDLFSSTLAYAVGGTANTQSTIYKWNGTSWSNERPGQGENDKFQSVDILSSSLAFAAGNDGTLWKWNGTSWSNDAPSTLDADDDFNDLEILTNSLAIAVGGITSSGTAYRWNGTSWVNEAFVSFRFLAIDIYSTSLAYVIGAVNREIWRWNGSGWINERPLVPTELVGIFADIKVYSPTLAFAVGGDTVSQVSNIAKWTGGTIPYPVDTGTEQTFPAVAEMKYPGDQEAHSMLQTLSTALDVEFERSYPNLSDASSPVIVAASADDAVHTDIDAGGDTQNITSTTVEIGRNISQNFHTGFRFQGVNLSQGTTISSAYLTFNSFVQIGTSAVPFTIYGEDADGGNTPSSFSAGNNGTIWRWNGSSWTNDIPSTADASDDFQSLDIFSSTLAYAVGGTADTRSTIYKWNGTSWSNEQPGQGENDIFRSVDVQSTTLAFAAGDDGTIWKWNGTSWSNDQPSGIDTTNDDFRSVEVFSSTLAYAVGGTSETQSTIYKWNGTSWSNERPGQGENDTFFSVDIYSSTLAFVVGFDGTIWKWNGISWTNDPPASANSDDDFANIQVFSSTLAIAVGGSIGTQTTIYKWNGTSWSNDTPGSPGDVRLLDVSVVSTTLAYAVGGSDITGRIYKWNGTSWTNDTLASSPSNFNSIDLYSTTLAMAVGTFGSIFRWNGTSWTNETPAGETDIFNAVDIFNAGDNIAFATSGPHQFVGNRTRTDRYKSYSVNFAQTSYRFDVTQMVQEIVCRGNAGTSIPCIGDYAKSDGNWVSGNALTLLLISTETGAVDQYVSINAQDGTNAIEPTLEINLSDDSTTNYSRGILTAAASTSDTYTNLGVSFSNQNFVDVGTNDSIYSDITNVASSSATRVDTPAFYFKKQRTSLYSEDREAIQATWIGKSSVATTNKTAYLDVYNNSTGLWETTDNDTVTAIDTKFTLTGSVSSSNILAFTVGGAGRIYRTYGSVWINDTMSSETNNFRSVDIFAPNLVYATGNSGRIYKWNGATWANETPVGESNTLNSIDVFSESLAFTVGDSGAIWKWNGTSWSNDKGNTDQLPNSNDDFQSLDIFSSSLAYAVGGTADSQSTIYRWNGTSWVNERPGSGENDIFKSVDIFSATLAFSVGYDGTIWKWNGTSWSNDPPASADSSDDFESIDILSSTLSFAVGGSIGRSTIYKWNGTSWSNDTPAGPSEVFASVDIYSASLAYAVGGNVTPLIWKWNGTSWSNESITGNNTLSSVDIYSPSLAYAVGGGINPQIFKWNGTSWSNETPAGETNNLLSIDILSPQSLAAYTGPWNYYIPQYYDAKWTNDSISGMTEVFRAVDIYSTSLAIAGATSNGKLFRWNGSGWTNESVGGTDGFQSVDIFSSSLAFAVGSTGLIFRWNGTSWTNEIVTTSQTLTDLDIFSTTLSFAVGGNGNVWKWNGTSWSNDSPAETDGLNSVDIFSSTLAFSVGLNGSIWKWNGTSWTGSETFDQTPNASDDFQSVEIFSSTLAYAVGGTSNSQSSIYKWNGTSWINERPSQGENDIFQSVDVFSTTLAFSAGDDGTLWKWNGTSWSNNPPEYVDVSDDFQEVQIYSNSLAYAVGGTSTTRSSVFKWNGISWSYDTPPWETNILNDVFIYSPALVMAVGIQGRIWRYSGSTSRNWSYWRVYQAATDGQGALGIGQVLYTDQITWAFKPLVVETMRHGNFFLQNLEKYFVW